VTKAPLPKPLQATITTQLSVAMRARAEEVAEREGIPLQEVMRRALSSYTDHIYSTSSLWETIDPNDYYDPDRFYTAGRDQQGHFSEVRVQIPTPLAGELARLVEDRRIPEYQTRQHVVRDAIYHRVKTIAKVLDDGKLEEAVNMAMLEADEIQEASRAENAKRLIDSMEANLKSRLARAEANGRWEGINAYIEDRAAKSQAVDEEWRIEYETVLREYRKVVKTAMRRRIR